MWEQIDATGDVHARLAAFRLGLAPRLVREARQANVVRRVVAVTDDPAVIVRRPAMVAAEIETFEPDHRLSGAAAYQAVALPMPPRPMIAMS
jgi:hypothetical protein